MTTARLPETKCWRIGPSDRRDFVVCASCSCFALSDFAFLFSIRNFYWCWNDFWRPSHEPKMCVGARIALSYNRAHLFPHGQWRLTTMMMMPDDAWWCRNKYIKHVSASQFYKEMDSLCSIWWLNKCLVIYSNQSGLSLAVPHALAFSEFLFVFFPSLSFIWLYSIRAGGGVAPLHYTKGIHCIRNMLHTALQYPPFALYARILSLYCYASLNTRILLSSIFRFFCICYDALKYHGNA